MTEEMTEKEKSKIEEYLKKAAQNNVFLSSKHYDEDMWMIKNARSVPVASYLYEIATNKDFLNGNFHKGDMWSIYNSKSELRARCLYLIFTNDKYNSLRYSSKPLTEDEKKLMILYIKTIKFIIEQPNEKMVEQITKTFLGSSYKADAGKAKVLIKKDNQNK